MKEEELVNRLVYIYIKASMAKDIGNVYGIANRRNMAAPQRIRRRKEAVRRKFRKELTPVMQEGLFAEASPMGEASDCPNKMLRDAVFFERSKILYWVLRDGGSREWYQKATGFKDSIMEQVVEGYEKGIKTYHFDAFLGRSDDDHIYENGIVWNDDRPFCCTARFREAQETLQKIRSAGTLAERRILAELLPKSYLKISSVQRLIEKGSTTEATFPFNLA